MTRGNLRAPQGAASFLTAALLLIGVLTSITATAEAQNVYRGLPPDALLRAAAVGPIDERPAILEALLDSRATSLPTLRQQARSAQSRESRLVAIGMLAEMRDDGGVPALLDAASDQDDDVRRSALAALRTLGDPRAAKRFRQLVHQGGRGGALKIAAAGLGKVGSADDLAALRALLASGDEGVRVTAAGSLAMLGSTEGAQTLLDAIDGDNPIAQKNATYALGFVRTAEAAARLQQIVDDPQGRWKSYAVISLAQHQRAGEAPDEELASLTLLGRGRDRIAANWAIDELTDLDHRDATEVLRELGGRHGALGAKARLRVKVREGR